MNQNLAIKNKNMKCSNSFSLSEKKEMKWNKDVNLYFLCTQIINQSDNMK